MMKIFNQGLKLATVVSLMLLLTLSLAFAATSPVGEWKTIDDKTGKAKSIVKITEANGVVSGRVKKVIKRPGALTHCNQCSGRFKNKPIQGMQIMWGFRPKGSKWSGGKILDPKNGKIYSANLQVVEGGKKLNVRGYVGIAALGRTQTWIRVK